MEKLELVTLRINREKDIPSFVKKIGSTKQVVETVQAFIGDMDREHLVLICIDNHNIPTLIQTIGVGTINEISTSPREVFKLAITSNASSIILAHNHPSGSVRPSKMDKELTSSVLEIGELLHIPLIDHVIVSGEQYYSFRSEGVL